MLAVAFDHSASARCRSSAEGVAGGTLSAKRFSCGFACQYHQLCNAALVIACRCKVLAVPNRIASGTSSGLHCGQSPMHQKKEPGMWISSAAFQLATASRRLLQIS